jgi:hypothetical protein
MNEFACVVYIGVFLIVPPLMLMLRLRDNQLMPWRVLFGVAAIGGWLLLNLAHQFHVNGVLVERSLAGHPANAPWMSPRSQFLFTFGGLFGPIYLLPWLCLYAGIVLGRWLWRGRA